MSAESCRKALHNVPLKPYKINVAHQLLPPDFEKQSVFCLWFQRIMTAELRDATFFSDEVWFHLSGYMNSQKIDTGQPINLTQFMKFLYMNKKLVFAVQFQEGAVLHQSFSRDHQFPELHHIDS
jgi:hypothetical protein